MSQKKYTMETKDEHSICNKNCSTDDMDVLKSTTDTDTDKLKMKYDNLTDVDDDKCVNNQNICNNNLKNAKIIHDTDCNAVIDNDSDDDGNDNQTKQLQQKQPTLESSPQPKPPPTPPPPPTPQQQQPSTYGCKHYKRKAKFVVSTNTHTYKQIHTANKQNYTV